MKRKSFCALSAALLTVFVIASAGSAAMPWGYETLFRYRCFEGSRPSWVSPIDAVGGIDHSSSADIHTIDRGTGFEDFISTDFDGSSEYIRASAAVDTTDSIGKDSFTIQAWFNADSVSGYRTLISNTYDYTGFSLKIKDGQLRSLIRFADGGGYVNHELIAGNVQIGKWHWGALSVKENYDSYQIRLFLDGKEIAAETIGNYDGIAQSGERPMIAAEPHLGSPAGDYFNGRIYAVTIANYDVSSDVLGSEIMADGSRYFGIPSYHDYLDSTESADWRIENMFDVYPHLSMHVNNRFFMPLMNDRYVPQGLATNGEDTIYMSMYYKHEDGTEGTYPSVVTESTTDGKLKRVLQLHYSWGSEVTSHVGGVAWWNDNLYLPYSPTAVMRYDISSLSGPVFDGDSFANAEHDQNKIYYDGWHAVDTNLNTGISFMSAGVDYDGTPILWLGQFDSSSYKYFFGYEIYSNGSLNSNPLYTFRLPVTKVQGLYCHKANRDILSFYMSTSYGDNPGYIYDVTYNKSNQSYVWAETKFKAPAGLEGMAMIGAELWCTGESGAKYYQNRDSNPWDDLFPFVFSCRFYRQGDVNIDGEVNEIDLYYLCDQWLGVPGQPSADIAGTWGDGYVDYHDFVQLGFDWYKDVLQ